MTRTHPQYERAIELPCDSELSDQAAARAGADGVVYLNIDTGELLLCDSADLILWRGESPEGWRLHCPKCSTAMNYEEGEDEFSTNELHWYAQWYCPNCQRVVRDFEDEFIFPGEIK